VGSSLLLPPSLLLAVIIEVIEHQVQIGIYILSQMIHHAFFFIDRYSKRWIIVGNDKTTSIDLLMSLSKVCVDYI
jgi:hypothetical protein